MCSFDFGQNVRDFPIFLNQEIEEYKLKSMFTLQRSHTTPLQQIELALM